MEFVVLIYQHDYSITAYYNTILNLFDFNWQYNTMVFVHMHLIKIKTPPTIPNNQHIVLSLI